MLDPDFKSDNEAYMEERTIISAMYGVSPGPSIATEARKQQANTYRMI
jgi:hypothetical protein